MSEARDELREALRAAAAGGRGPHPEPQELAAYGAGELSAEAERRIQDHLVACRECAALLLDLDGLADPGFGAGRPGAPAEREQEAAWESFRREIAAAAPEPAPIPPVGRGRFGPPPRPSRPLAPRWLYALAATLLLTVGGLSFQVVSLSRQVAELSRPELNSTFVDLFAGTARGATPAAPVEVVRSQARFLTLALHPPPLPPYGEYQVEIRDARGPRLSLAGRPLGLSHVLTVTVPREALGAGDYQVRVFGIDGSRRVKVEEHAFRVLP